MARLSLLFVVVVAAAISCAAVEPSECFQCVGRCVGDCTERYTKEVIEKREKDIAEFDATAGADAAAATEESAAEASSGDDSSSGPGGAMPFHKDTLREESESLQGDVADIMPASPFGFTQLKQQYHSHMQRCVSSTCSICGPKDDKPKTGGGRSKRGGLAFLQIQSKCSAVGKNECLGNCHESFIQEFPYHSVKIGTFEHKNFSLSECFDSCLVNTCNCTGSDGEQSDDGPTIRLD